MKNFIVSGGIYFTLPILLIGFTNVVMFILVMRRKLKGSEINLKSVDVIIFAGSFALIYGMFGQVLGFYQAAGAIQQAQEISPSIIWGGFRVSLIAPIMGFVVLFISGIMWFVVKPVKRVSS
jgi:hypothetical protein